MQTNAVKLYSLAYQEGKTYGMTLLFVAGNVLFPQLCHLLKMGGPTWLPLYFFTLIGAYKYGWRVGLLTALNSPLFNSAVFGMPALAVLPGVLWKSVSLALIAGFTACRYRKVSLGLIGAVILAYQGIGTLGEWVFTGSFYEAWQDFRIGIPGMLLQWLGGWALIRYAMRR